LHHQRHHVLEQNQDLSKFDQEKVKKVKTLIKDSEHKRNIPEKYKI